MKMRQVVAMVCVVVAHCAFAALPPECTRLEYIASTGEQYIDTGIKLKCPDDRVYMKFMCTTLGNGGVLFGNRKTHQDHCFMASYNNWQLDNFSVNINNSSLNRWTNQSRISYLNQMMEIDAQINSITVIRNGTDEYPFVSQLNDTFETIGTCTVLKGVAVDGGTLPNANGAIGRLYSFKIFRNGHAILDLVPVQTNGVALMCDRLTGTYYPNVGTGDFAAGPAMDLLTISKDTIVPSCSPAPGGYDLSEAGYISCSAHGSYTNYAYMVRSAVTGFTLETYNSLTGTWGSPVTNAGNSFAYSPEPCSEDFVRLTWLAKENQEVLVQSNPIRGGNMIVNGTPMPAARDVRWTPPPGAVAVEYIASTGEQYIDTGVKLRCPDDRVYMKFMCTTLGNGGVLFGNRKTYKDHCFIAHYNYNWSDFSVNINNSNINRWMNDSGISYTGQMMEIDAAIRSMTVIRNGTNEYPFVSQLNNTFETIGTCTVLKGVAVEGGTLPNDNGVIGRLYHFEIKRNGVPILDLLPVTTNGVACMYDLVSGKYFGNAGTGAFSAGPELAEDVCSEIWVSTGIETTLLAKPARCFKRWMGDVLQSEESVNPLVWTLSRSVRITPLFHLGFRIDLR